ncbi:MAG: hypothetical protein OXF72_06320 [Gammaproteobacteria bacterium]|nr:hypothetical protein [Gammaproteobacteria bacterium]MCY4200284.1 hypothetical protein [Gammaproteobacteria bacterium]MCY4278076.1 hypothetical protein [Gammaproteobacteria bacterium]MCY4323891.1 hypothetical protein [Gammaproteobacteria bacterium]
MRDYDLALPSPRHQGHIGIDDHHATRPIHEVASEKDTRFFGLKRKFGLHEFDFVED